MQSTESRRRSTRISKPVSVIHTRVSSATTSDLFPSPGKSTAPSSVIITSKQKRSRDSTLLDDSPSQPKKPRVSTKPSITKSSVQNQLSRDIPKKNTKPDVKSKGKGKAKVTEIPDHISDSDQSITKPGIKMLSSPEASDDEKIIKPTSKAAGKRRMISSSDDDEPLMNNHDDVVISEIEEEMVEAVIELSKRELQPIKAGSSSKLEGKSTTHRRITSLPAKRSQRPNRKSVPIVYDEDEESTDEEVIKKSNSKPKTTRELTNKRVQSTTRPQRNARKSAPIENDQSDEGSAVELSDFEGEVASSDLSSLENRSGSDSDETTSRPQKTRTKSPRRKAKGKKSNLTWWQRNQLALEKYHPELIDVWGDLTQKVEIVQANKAEQPDGLSLTLLPFQLEGLYWMKKQEAGPWAGGMLADEMGMGKTIQTISLILSDRKAGDGKQTLVIAPTVAIIQWRNEIEKFTKGLKVNVWHGGNRSTDKKTMKSYDIVLTSYAVLESSFRRQNSGYRKFGELRKEASLLHSIHWHRVILDEAHNIKDRSCNTAKGAFELQATFKWCLSGTPLQNRVGELYSLIRFLGADPFGYYFCKKCDCKSLHWMFSNKRSCDDCGHSPMQHVCFWNNEILKPVQKYGASIEGSHGHTAFNKLKVLLDRMMLRRTKLERADDLGLPPRAVHVRRDYFTEEEEELYSSLYSDVKRKFSTFADAGTVLNNYGNIFQLITRMRQMSNHPDLVLKSKVARAAFNMGDEHGDLDSIHTCRLCLDEAEDAIISCCKHIFCRECIRQYLETASEVEPECPVCHLPISIDLSQEAIDEESSSKARQGVLARLDPGKWRTSTKIEALVEELSKLNKEDHSIKSLVFSQFTVFLDLIERRLQLAGFKLARLQGHMTPEARDRTIKHFMNNNDVQVFLVSLKAGGVALNLTEASRVFIMDPWWNPAVELQAMDRIHRLGQHRPVVVTRLIIENSIESRIVELQKKKEAMTGAALGDDDQALGRLTPEDLSFLFTL